MNQALGLLVADQSVHEQIKTAFKKPNFGEKE